MEGSAPEPPAPQPAAASGTHPRPENRAPGGSRAHRGNRAWGTVAGFGLVSLVTDLVSDGARSLAGPLLGQLGATALVVGLVTGGAEAAAQGLRVVFGPWADRTRRYWSFTVAGYAMTVVSVPLLAVAPGLGAGGLATASALIIADRVGKAVRSPAKTVLLAAAAADVGRGRGFACRPRSRSWPYPRGLPWLSWSGSAGGYPARVPAPAVRRRRRCSRRSSCASPSAPSSGAPGWWRSA